MMKQNNRISVYLVATVAGSIILSGCSNEEMAEVTAEEKAAIESRIRPVVTLDDIMGKSGMAEVKTPAAPAADSASPMTESAAGAATGDTDTAMKLYNGACMACHSTGAAGAPMLGDAAAWEPRAAAGMDAMMNTAKTGKGAMPPNGGSAYNEAQMRQVIEYMLAQAGLQI